MGSRGGEDSQQGGGWWTQRDGGLWNGAGQTAASRPHKVEAGGLCSPTFMHRYTRRNGGGSNQTTQPRAPARGNKTSNL